MNNNNSLFGNQNKSLKFIITGIIIVFALYYIGKAFGQAYYNWTH